MIKDNGESPDEKTSHNEPLLRMTPVFDEDLRM